MEEKKDLEKIFLETTIIDIKLHNSKINDDSWVDISVRAQGEANITAAMLAYKALDKIAKLTFNYDNR